MLDRAVRVERDDEGRPVRMHDPRTGATVDIAAPHGARQAAEAIRVLQTARSPQK